MFSKKVSSKRSPLAPQMELQLINIYLDNGRTASKKGQHQIALVLCEEAEASLSKMKKCMKAAQVQDVTDLRHGVACAFLELSKLLEEMNQQERAKESRSKAHAWGNTEVEMLSISTRPSLETGISIATHLSLGAPVPIVAQPPLKTTNTTQLSLKASGSTAAQQPLETTVSVLTQPARDTLATIDVDKAVDGDVLIQGRAPSVIEHKLPEPDALKDPGDIAEVACIGPFLNRNNFRALLEQFIVTTQNSNLLNIHTLDGLAKLVQGANEGYLEADDLVRILTVLNARLQATHAQTDGYIYQLMWPVSRVLDAMANCKVEGLDRVTLHERLSGYINELKSNTDPHMVYLAAYTFQALECVPDNESPWQATRRRTGKVMEGLFGLVKAVKGLDVNGFLEGIGHIEGGLDGAVKVFQTLQDGATALKVLQRLKDNGDEAKRTLYSDCLKQGPSKYPMMISQPQFATVTLLDRVQNKPDVEEDLRKLRQRRLKEQGDAVYIPPQAKPNLNAMDDALFDLTEKVEEFLDSKDQKVLLLLGDSGSGKSTFNRQIEYDLWKKYNKSDGRIPLYINLSARSTGPGYDCQATAQV
ncbi:hypothetical protein BGX24_003069 [Mortierella sp. AD032]|nr:hypothetical protein BGX24_003069 [Mortierella sp. AD032]